MNYKRAHGIKPFKKATDKLAHEVMSSVDTINASTHINQSSLDTQKPHEGEVVQINSSNLQIMI